jgi:imidazolonepropionase-like amidohydrolase
VFANGSVFDGTGLPPAPADVVAESGRILEAGPGLDGDQVVDCTGLPVLPGLFDCHVHVTVASIGMPDITTRPFSLQFSQQTRHLTNTLGIDITTVRDAARANLGRTGCRC